MKTLVYGRKEYGLIADQYNELSGKQLMRIAAILIKGEDELLANLRALRVLLKMNLFRFFMVPADAKQRMLEHCTWIFERNGLTKQLITYYRGMYGPADDFDNLTMGEWNACEIFYRDLVEESSDEALDKLVAVLYRKAKPEYDRKLNTDGDIRQPFKMFEIDYYSKKIKHWPAEVKLSVLLWFDGCREQLKQCYSLFDGTGTAPGDPGMFDVIRGLCGDKYGSMKNVEDLNVHLALRELDAMKKEAAEIEKQYKNAGK
jgi:hypothetical protein